MKICEPHTEKKKKNRVLPGSTFINENVVLRANGHPEEKQTADF